jgi:hypothetical protein
VHCPANEAKAGSKGIIGLDNINNERHYEDKIEKTQRPMLLYRGARLLGFSLRKASKLGKAAT